MPHNSDSLQALIRAITLLPLLSLLACASQTSNGSNGFFYGSMAGFDAVIFPSGTELALDHVIFEYDTSKGGDIVSDDFVFARFFSQDSKTVLPYQLANTRIERTVRGTRCTVVQATKNGTLFGQYCISKSRGILQFNMNNLQGGDSFELTSRVGLFHRN